MGALVDVRRADVARDLVALACLIPVLIVPWDLAAAGGGHWWVLLATLVSVASLAIPYVSRSGALSGFGAREAALAKLVANAPAGACLVVALINEVVHVKSDAMLGGLGAGFAFLGVGVVLAVQPRSDEDSSFIPARVWRPAGILVGGLGIALGFFTWLAFTATGAGVWDSPLFTIGALWLAGLGVYAVMTVRPLYGILARDLAWLRVWVVVGATILGVAFIASLADPGVLGAAIGRLRNPLDSSYALLPIAVAMLVAAPARKAMTEVAPLQGWLATIRAALFVMGVSAALLLVGGIFAALGYGEFGYGSLWTASYITVVVIVALEVAAAVACWVVLSSPRTATTRIVLVGVLGFAIVMGMVAIAVGYDGGRGRSFDWMEVAVLLVFPSFLIGALTVPTSVREAFGPLVPPGTARPTLSMEPSDSAPNPVGDPEIRNTAKEFGAEPTPPPQEGQVPVVEAGPDSAAESERPTKPPA